MMMLNNLDEYVINIYNTIPLSLGFVKENFLDPDAPQGSIGEIGRLCSAVLKLQRSRIVIVV